MYPKIALVSMPFAALATPSIALTQLKSVLKATFDGKLCADVIYLNHEFGPRLGVQLYEFIAHGRASTISGFGEWLFRQAAFPDSPDNSPEYVRRFASHLDKELLQHFTSICTCFRAGLPALLDELIEKYALDEADVVGMTSMFQQNLPSIALARRLKAARPEQLIVMGGANCEGTMGIELINHVDVIDFVFSGHSLISFPQFVRNVIEGQPERCHGLDGVFSRQNSRSIESVVEPGQEWDWSSWRPASQLLGVRPSAPELDVNAELDLDYEDFFQSLGECLPGPALGRPAEIMFETSRGCWWGERAHCTFCGLNGQSMSYRAMHPDRALALIEGLIRRYSNRTHKLQCVDNILPREYFSGVFPRLRPPDHLTLFYEVKADLTEEQVKTLAAARVLEIQPGVEALATSTLKLMHKGTTAFQNLSLLRHCRAHGVLVGWNLLVGFPGESAAVYEQYMKLLPNLFHLQPPTGIFPVRFDRFSPYFTQAAQFGLSLAPYESYEFAYPFPPRALMNMAYYFRDTDLNASYANDVAHWLTPMTELVTRWRNLWSTTPTRPELGVRKVEQRPVVEDTRAGYPVTSRLSSQELELLRRIATPTRLDTLGTEQRPALERLRGLRLVFEERERVMALA